MANITVTYTFANSTTADATQVNTNFTDIINGTSDGTKDFSIAALTLAGTLTANGNVNLGNASSDDLTITASLASSLPIKTTNSYDIGSADLGLRAIYLGTSDTDTGKLEAGTLTADRTYTFPNITGTVGVHTGATYTPTWGAGFGTVSNSAGYYRQMGDQLYVIASCTVGTAAASSATISLPSGYAIDLSKLTINNTSSNPGNWVGIYQNAEALDDTGGNIITAPSTSTSVVYFSAANRTANSKITPANGTSVTASSVVLVVQFIVPISA